ncbi:IS1/IS1595 family N-terminal zinc-binding domain-containing protein [Nostoc sp.]
MILRPQCPRCYSLRVYKNGGYTLPNGTFVQRWFCQNCRKSFS